MNISEFEFFNYANNLKYIEILDLFSKEWFENHKNIVFINAYLHSNNDILDNIGDDRIDVIVNKFEILLKEIITIYFIRFINFEEGYKNKKECLSAEENKELKNMECFKKNTDIEACNNFRISSYISLYHEMSILNIFEFLLFSDSIYESIDSHMINLYAYIYSNLVAFLKTSSDEYFVKPMNELSISEMLKEENDKTYNIDKLKIYINVINTLRNITDRIHLLNNTVVNKIVDYDILLILIPLMEKKPWRKENYIFEKNEWIKIEDNTLATVEKQLWLILYTLILNKSCQEKYEMTNYRRNNILKLRKYMNENLYEQIPPLKTLHIFIEHLYISKNIYPEKKNSYLIIDVVPDIFDKIKNDILKNKKEIISLLNNVKIKKDVLENISNVYFSIYEFDQENNKSINKSSSTFIYFLLILKIHNINILILEYQNASIKRNEKKKTTTEEYYICNNCKENAELQCSQCKRIYYCSKECQMKDWFNHREECSNE
ncbi:MYND finger protein, putative [Plasmodium gallinaceum]|uniref:MYND finger protein, putative n=1 Tax=Plasmodium gallinaceum TaxID=5849 RepID=A0A1J1GMT9_PLAGA|nr:MYND finger protein, putative [Plasmodium gallinaceum]CRG93651.1 MYND finger protein, putative [Plasmodium gallinaceum]